MDERTRRSELRAKERAHMRAIAREAWSGVGVGKRQSSSKAGPGVVNVLPMLLYIHFFNAKEACLNHSLLEITTRT